MLPFLFECNITTDRLPLHYGGVTKLLSRYYEVDGETYRISKMPVLTFVVHR